MFVLSLVLSCDALMAGPVMRAGALRLNTNSTSTPKSTATTSSTASVGALATYERASRLRPNRVQVSSSSGSSTVNQEILNKVYEEMSRVTNAVEQELYITQREIDKLKDEIAEKDDKISDLEEALAEYEEVKTTVKNIPNIYYSKKEVDAKGYVMPSTLNSAIETAKTTVKKEALDEVKTQGFITSSAVADEIAQAKTAAVGAAVAQVENMNFATANSVAAAESRMANAIDNAKTVITKERNAALQLYAKASDVASEISVAKDTAIADAKQQAIAAIEDKNYATKQFVNDEISNLDFDLDEVAVGTIIENKLSAKDFATNTALEGERTARENALKEYATISVVEDRINNLDLGVDETAVATIVENKLTAKDFATNTALQGERTARENALKEYATKEEVEGVDNKFKDISETVAVDLAKNDNFKAQVLSSLDTSISELPSKVTAVENKLATMNNQLFDDEEKPVFVKKPELDTLITVDLIDSKLPTTVCKTKACLTATIGSHYATADDVDNKVELKVKNELYDGGDTQKPKFVTGTVLLEKTDGLSSRIDGITPRIASVESAVKSENLKTTIKNMGEFALSSEVASAKEAAIEAAATQAGKLFIKSSDLANNATIVNLNNKFDKYATTAALNNVDGKFQNYTTTAKLNDTVGNLAVIKALPTSDAVNSAIDAAKTTVINDAAGKYATTAALNNVDGKFQNYTTTANLGNVDVIKTMQGSIATNTTNITTNANKFSKYTTTADMNSAITTAKNAAISQAATDRTAALQGYATTSSLDDGLNTVKNALISATGKTNITFNNSGAPSCTSTGCTAYVFQVGGGVVDPMN